MRQRGPVLARWVDAWGKRRRVSARTRAAVEAAMRDDGVRRSARLEPEPIVLTHRGGPLPAGCELTLEDGTNLGEVRRVPRDLPYGYHRLASRRGEQLLLVAPARCPLPEGYREWAWAVQLYGARSHRSWGVGDLGDLDRVAVWSRRAGAGALMVSPMGAPNPGPAPEPSPYFPSTRRFRDPLLVRIESVPGADAVAARIARLAERGRGLNAVRRIDRGEALRLKRAALEAIWSSGHALGGEVAGRLAAFTSSGGEPLRAWATFVALSERLGTDWRGWPEAYRRPRSSEVGRFAEEQRDRIAHHTWIQWLIDEQLGSAARSGPRVVGDLPIGFDPGGFDAWEWQEMLASGASIGAPPDQFNPHGQDWGLPPFIPDRLRACGLRPVVETLRAALRHAGGLRIDHALGLFRLWWVPHGAAPGDGAYVRYPFDELVAVLAIETTRSEAIVIGEDLGTIETGARRTLAASGLLSTRLAYFEARPPPAYPRRVLAAITNHDLPTLAGTWTGRDLDDQRAAGAEADPRQLARLRRRIARLAGVPVSASTAEATLGAYAALAASPACLVSATLEDALQVVERPNLPGTTGERRPNWSLALPAPIEAMEDDPLVARLAEVLRRPGRGIPPRERGVQDARISGARP